MLGVQAEPQVAVRSGDQAQPQSQQEFEGEQVARLVDERKFFKQNHNFSGSGGTNILLDYVALGCHSQFNKVGQTI